ncbi:MAG: DUF4197 domain-containing protein [Gammaproteobacteria bacterium]|nr:DUF4197 domain-containing protein [Gammaproteobacteria bacterium]
MSYTQHIIFSLLIFTIAGCALNSADTQRILQTASVVMGESQSGLSREEVVAGLKQALSKGADLAIQQLGQPGGFNNDKQYRIPLPAPLPEWRERLAVLGLSNELNKLELTMNRAAEQAVADAVPIFVDSITQMTINDALGILRGSPTAATDYFQRTAGAKLQTRFRSVVLNATADTGAAEHYDNVVTVFNRVRQLQGAPALPSLDEYVANKAGQALFSKIALEEKRIRAEPAARTTALLKRVFAPQ